ncbi:nidogen-1 [Octodon degus]|uniref:Nidogen-1 n=1 Tax=Octodon degus TaxID=10160 RepID=A0A6P6D951_OCTDE|nr:nidogen-1 [Octodon degus]
MQDVGGRSAAAWVRALLLPLLLTGPGGCLSHQDLFPYGPLQGDLELEDGDDIVSPALELSEGLHFYDRSGIDSVYVTTNGIIAMSKPPAKESHPGLFPPTFGAVAPFLADLDTTDGLGKVYYREDLSFSATQLAAEYVQRGFPEVSFQPISVVVVTWESVAPYQGPSRNPAQEGQRNTFQAVLASSNASTYAIFLYPQGGLQFYTTFSKKEKSQVPAMVAFSQGLVGLFWKSDGEYDVFANDSKSIENLTRNSNSGRQGMWVFEIGSPAAAKGVVQAEVNLGPNSGANYEGEVEDYDQMTTHLGLEDASTPSLPFKISKRGDTDSYDVSHALSPRHETTEGSRSFQLPVFSQQQVFHVEEMEETGSVFPYNTDSQQTCANNRHQCSVHAECRDYSTGFCCRCVAGYMGNGRQCVAEGSPQRVNGKVKGRIFLGSSHTPIVFENTDLHSYVVMNHGRSYTAISTIPETVGYSLLPLAPIGGIIGWMFAVEQNGFKNGFSITGGEFTRQAEVTFVGHPGKLVIKQQFSGIDEHGHLTIDTELEGRVPQIPAGSSVAIEPYTELYHYSGSGESTLGDGREGSPDALQNPCYIGTHGCDTNAACRPGQGTTFTCECSIGFRGDGRTCYDIDECSEQPSVCGSQAICNNQPGTFRCECVEGYRFSDDGKCVAIVDQRPIDYCATGLHDCDIPQRATCIYMGGSSYTCSCLPGFSGDGRACQDVDECQPSRCHPDAFCYNTPGSFTCQCKPGYQGDGFQCVPGEVEKTRCQQEREHILGAVGAADAQRPRPLGLFVPECDEHGHYVPTQCHGSTGYCWCVDRDGRELEGTRTRPGLQPPCLGTVAPAIHQRPVLPTSVIPLPPGTHLLFAQTGKIERLPLEGNTMKKAEAKAFLHVPEKIIIGLAYDCVDKMVYWTDITEPCIGRASLHGGEPATIVHHDLGSPEGIAIDHLGRNMFWTDSHLDRIEVAKLDGTQRRVLFDTDLVNPRSIITDPVRGNLYWTDWNRDNPKIETSYMDGTNRRILAQDELILPNGLTFDPFSSQLCWVDAGTHRAECLNPSQPSVRKVLSGLEYPFAVTSFGKNLYYTDWKRNSVVAVDLAISSVTDTFHPHKQSRPYGITTTLSQCPQGHNYCSVNNGGCTHLCLATPGSRTCRCPDNTPGVDCIERN